MSIDKNLLTAATLCGRMADDKELKYFSFALWHRLIEFLGEKNILNPSELLGMSETALAKTGFPDEFLPRFVALLDTVDEVAEKIDNLRNTGVNIIGMDNECYPEKILSKLQRLSPPILFYAGNKSLLNNDAISVVGSRKPSKSAISFANKLGKTIVDNGYTLISGGADGCDCIAESSATDQGGNAVIYLAVPLEKRMRNSRMAKLIVDDKICLVSDHNPYGAFNAGYAINRNRYIYSCAKCAVVCESGAEKGGSYNGAIKAIDGKYANVVVFDNEKCYGNQMLKLNGAYAAKTVDEVIDFAVKE